MPGSSLRLASVIVNSVSMSDSDRTPRMMTRASHSRTNCTASPANCRTIDVAQRLRHPLDQLDPLVGREQRFLVDVHADADDQLIDEPAAPLDHVEMPERDRIERTGVDGAAGHGRVHEAISC